MKWTIQRRISVGYGLVVMLLALVAAAALYTIPRTSGELEAVIRTQEAEIIGALRAQAAFKSAVISFLRYQALQEDTYLQRRQEETVEARQAIVQLLDGAVSPERRASWSQVLGHLNAWDESASSVIEHRRAGRGDEADQIMVEAVIPARDEGVDLLDQLVEVEGRRADERTQTAIAAAARATRSIQLFALLSLIGAIIMTWVLIRSITGPLQAYATELAGSAAAVLAATSQQAAGTAEQATAVQQTSTSVDEIRQTVHLASEKARAVAATVKETVETSLGGQQAVKESVEGIRDTRTQTEAIAERILALSERGQDISEIITTVRELAEQLNILSVNAGIEAAKSGEAGKGFSVVATEIKSLAEEAKQGTVQVERILNEIQKATQAAVMTAEQGVKASQTAEALALRAGAAIEQLSANLNESAQAARQIEVTGQQQVAGVDQIAQAMQNIQQAATQHIAATQQLETTAKDLSRLANELKAATGVPEHGGSSRNAARTD